MKTAVFLFVLCGCIACSSNKTKQEMKISIELDVFSGRPNPLWELNPSESGELLKQLSPLPEADKNKAEFFDGLGYRGFIISVQAADKTTSSPVIYRVYKGFILANDKVFSDKNSVEKKLTEQARNKGFADLVDSMQITD
jgi:hypothetical protein